MGQNEMNPPALYSSFMWITGRKLWISRSNWGKVVRLFELHIIHRPPYLGVGFEKSPYVQEPCGIG